MMRIKVAILLKVSNGNKCVHEFANVKVKRTHCPYNFASLRAHQLTFPSSSCFLVGDVTKFWILFPDEMVKVISDQMGDQMEQAKAVIDQLDVDKDGKVSYPEFILVMKYKK